MSAVAAPGTWRLLAGAGALLGLSMVASFTPTPLYATYQADWGLGDPQISLAFAGYPAGVLVVLLGLGGLSDRIGRRPTLLAGAAMLVVAMLVLAGAGALAVLVLGRFLQGCAAGLITGAAAAALVERHPGGADRGSVLNTGMISLGAALGPALAGTLAAASRAPLVVPYLVVAALVALPVLLLAPAGRLPEIRRSTGRLVQPIRVPPGRWAAFSVAAGAVMVTNLCMSLYGAFGPQVAAAVGWTSEAAAGRLVSLALGAVAVAQLAGRFLPHLRAARLGAVLASLGWALAALGTSRSSAVAALAGTVLIGLGGGLGLLGGAALVGRISPPQRRAETYSAFLVVGFGTLGAAALVAGPLLDRLSLPAVLLGTAGVTAVIAAHLVVTGAAARQRLLAPTT